MTLCRHLVGLALFLILVWAVPLHAQVRIGAQRVGFESSDHLVVLSNGSAAIASYQAILLDASADAVSGVPLQTGAVVPRASVAVLPAPLPPGLNAPAYVLTMTQLGLTVPPCTIAQATCPIYTVVLLSIGPNGTSARGIAAESDPFQAVSSAVPPAGPKNVKALP